MLLGFSEKTQSTSHRHVILMLEIGKFVTPDPFVDFFIENETFKKIIAVKSCNYIINIKGEKLLPEG